MSTNGVSMGARISPMMFTGGDPAEAIAALALTSSSDQKKMAELDRDAAEHSEISEGEAQVAAIHEKANALRAEATVEMAAGIITGSAEAVGGGLTIAGGLVSDEELRSAFKGIGLGVEGGAKIGAAVLGKVAGDDKANAVDLDADASSHATQADLAKHRVDDARDMARDATDSANKTLDWYRDYSSARSQATAAALHRA